MRLQSQVGGAGGGAEKYSLDSGAVNNIKEVLTEQQRGIQVSQSYEIRVNQTTDPFLCRL